MKTYPKLVSFVEYAVHFAVLFVLALPMLMLLTAPLRFALNLLAALAGGGME